MKNYSPGNFMQIPDAAAIGKHVVSEHAKISNSIALANQQITTDGTNIATNTTNIATNTANIATNTASIGTINTTLAGLGTAATKNVGVAAGNVVQLDVSTAKLPAVDGSLLTNLPLQTETMVLLNTLTPSGVATINDTTSIVATYDEYMIVLRNVVPATNNAGLLLRISQDAGATYKATTYDTMITGALVSGTASGAETEGTGYLLSGKNVVFDGVSNNASYGVSGLFYLHSPNNSTSRKMISGSVSWLSGGVARREVGTIGGHYDGNNIAINALQFIFTAGNITSGSIKIYGIRT